MLSHEHGIEGHDGGIGLEFEEEFGESDPSLLDSYDFDAHLAELDAGSELVARQRELG